MREAHKPTSTLGLHIKIERMGPLYGFVVFDGLKVVATDVWPRWSRKAAKRAAERAGGRYLRTLARRGPVEEHYGI